MLQQIEYFKNIGIEIDLVRFNNLFNPIKFIKQIVENYSKYQDYILHAQYGSGTAIFTVLLKSRKKVLSIRGSDWFLLKKTPKLKEKINSYLGRYLTIISMFFYDEIIVMSEQMKTQIETCFPSLNKRIKIITDGIDLNKFHPMDKNLAKSKTNLPKDKFIVGIGTIDEKNTIKQVFLAKRAIDSLVSNGLPIYLNVLTDLDHNDMNLHINACDLILLTSIYEGWPNIIKEGLACNVPFVSTNVSDLANIAKEVESGCQIVDPLVSDIIRGLECSYQNIFINKCNYNLVKHIEKFEIKTSVKKIKDIYLNLNS